jgi:hypothetical protein
MRHQEYLPSRGRPGYVDVVPFTEVEARDEAIKDWDVIKQVEWRWNDIAR